MFEDDVVRPMSRAESGFPHRRQQVQSLLDTACLHTRIHAYQGMASGGDDLLAYVNDLPGEIIHKRLISW